MGRLLRVRKKNTPNSNSTDSSQLSDASSASLHKYVPSEYSSNTRAQIKTEKLKNRVNGENVANGNAITCSDSCSDDCNENKGTRSVLVDKTNSVLKNKVNSSDSSQVSSDSSVKSHRSVLKESSNTRVGVKSKLLKHKPVPLGENKKLNTISNCSDNCLDGNNKNEDKHSVLVDKTDLMSTNKVNNNGVKNKVQFSSLIDSSRCTQRQVTDFFQNSETSDTDVISPPGPSYRDHRKKILKSVMGAESKSELETGSKSTCTMMKPHVPIYKLPVMNGRQSFRLTPPQVKNKDALYEFEVDENEPVVNRKKRRPIKIYKKRKRICQLVNDIKPSDFSNIPQRTMALRNDGLENNIRIDYNEHNDSNTLDLTKVYDPFPSESKLKMQTECNAGRNRSVKLRNVANQEYIQRPLRTMKVNNRTEQGITSHGNNIQSHCKHPKEKCELTVSVDVHSSCNNRKIDDVNYEQNSVHSNMSKSALLNGDHSNNDVANSTGLTQQLQDISVCSSASRSPLPEYSRISEGVCVGPLHLSSSINCSDTEYKNTFIRGVTASTPYRAVNSPRHTLHDTFHVRLSGGEVPNQLRRKIIEESDEETEFFGFDNHGSPEKTLRPENHQIHVEDKVVGNEPVQKISVNEVINLLKREVYGKKKCKGEHRVTFQTLYGNSSRFSQNFEKSLNSSDNLSDTKQTTINSFLNTTNTEAKKNEIPVVELNSSFVNPPRRSYTCNTPRRARRQNYADAEPMSEEELHEIEPTKPQKKLKRSKKEEKEMERLAAMMNSQFNEVDKFSLVVE